MVAELVPEERPSDNVVVTRRTLLIAGIVIAVAGVLIIGGGVWLAWRVGGIASKNTKALDGLREITKPTPKEYRKQLREGFRRCAKEPACVRVLRRLLHAGPSSGGGGGRSPGTSQQSPRRPPPTSGGRGDQGPPGPPGPSSGPSPTPPPVPIPCVPLVCSDGPLLPGLPGN